MARTYLAGGRGGQNFGDAASAAAAGVGEAVAGRHNAEPKRIGAVGRKHLDLAVEPDSRAVSQLWNREALKEANMKLYIALSALVTGLIVASTEEAGAV